MHIITAECRALGDWQRHWWGSPIAISEASDNTSHSVSNVCLKRLSLHHFQSLIFQAAWFQIQLHFRLSWARSYALLWSPVPSVTDFKVRAKGKCQHQSCSWFSWVLWLWQSEWVSLNSFSHRQYLASLILKKYDMLAKETWKKYTLR